MRRRRAISPLNARTLAAVGGMFGGFTGTTFALLLIIGVVDTIISRDAGAPLNWALATLVAYTIGIIGGAIAMQRPQVATALLILGGIAGFALSLGASASTSAVVGSPAALRGTNVAAASLLTNTWIFLPYLASALLIVAALLAHGGSESAPVGLRRASDRLLTKTCPSCGGVIRAEATMCRFCQHEFPEARSAR